jgi:hypothetical protein
MKILHPPFDHLLAVTDGERGSGRAAAHLRACPRCRETLAAIRGTREAARAATSLPLPPGAWAAIAGRVQAGERVVLPAAGSAVAGPADAAPAARTLRLGAPRRESRHLLRAAVLVLGVAGVASATVVPLRRWIAAVAGERHAAAPVPGRGSGEPAAPPAAPAATPVSAGIGALPLDGAVRIEVVGSAPALRIRVRLVDADRATVRGWGEAATAGFRSGHGRITVTGASAGELEILLPRGVEHASVTVGGRRFLTREGAQLRILVPADSSGTEILFPGAAGRGPAPFSGRPR